MASQIQNDRYEVNSFNGGTQNRLDPEEIAKDSAQDSLNWLTVDGKLELARGRQVFGDEGTSGAVRKIWIAYEVDGDPVYFRQTNTSFQYLNAGVWTDTNITNLTSTDTFTFVNYQNLYQNAVYISGPTGLFKINVGNPATVLSYATPVLATDRHVFGYMTILDGRAYRWNITQPSTDLTGLYVSFIDKSFISGTIMSNTVLATGNGVQTVFTGTLALTGYQQPQAILFNTNPATTAGYVDLNGNVQWTGVTGTVNLTTGAYTLTFAVAPTIATQIRASYTLVDDTNQGILQNIKAGSYTSSVAFENKAYRQDEGGDPIKSVVVGIDGNVFSLKESNTYRFVPDATDTAVKNEIYRKDLGVQSLDAAASTSLGIYVINSTNTNYPELILLEKNPLGDNILSTPKQEQFDFSIFSYDQLQMFAWDRFVVAACKSSSSLTYNDRLLMMDMRRNTVDIVATQTNYCLKDRADLYTTSPFANITYKMFTGFTVDEDSITNYWISKDEDYSYAGLKKMKRFFIKGTISTSQKVEIYLIMDNQTPFLIGTILGTQDYVDASNSGTVGFSGVGEESVGGGGSNQTTFVFLTEYKTGVPKYRIRAIKFVATGIGYVNIDMMADNRIEKAEMRIPKKYRIQSNRSKSDELTNQFPFQAT